jgi:carboxyl-terminal processing protease
MIKAAQSAGNKSGSTVSANAPQFGQINLTMAKFYRVNGSTTQHKGVVPDIEFPTVFPKDKYGESSEPRALPWDTIAPSKYTLVANLDEIKGKLLSMHKERVKNSLGYKNLQQDIADFAKREAETTITLNELLLKKERDSQEANVLERENQRRIAKGLPPLKKGETKPKDDLDFIRDEGLQIMADYIRLK